jgi:predicted DsbA family dithiol-disulfide isomerase
MRIDVVLDLVCPWCFIGKRRLETALAMRPGIVARRGWRPFQLNPDMPQAGVTRHDYLAAKFGGSHHAQRVYQSVSDAGITVGIAFDFDAIERTPNTRDAHRLVRLAEREGCADALVEAMFRAYFIAGRDLGDPATLAALAADSGLDRAAATRFLASDVGVADVVAEDRFARRAGINAVPCFIFDGNYAIAGAQEPEFFLPVFDLVRHGGGSEAA